MESESNASTPTRCSPEEPSRRVLVSSLLNGPDVDDTLKVITHNVGERRVSSDSEPLDSAIGMDMESRSSDDEDDLGENEMSRSRQDLHRQGPTPARLRKKQWTHEHVRRLQQLYKEEQRWDVIAEKLGRSAVACKLKHNKELRRKAPIVMPIPRESLHSGGGPQQLVNEALGAIASLKQQLMDDASTMINRVHDSVEEAFSSISRHQAEADQSAGRRSRFDATASIEHLQQQLSWEISTAIGRERQQLGDAWAAIAQLQNHPPTLSPAGIPCGIPRHY